MANDQNISVNIVAQVEGFISSLKKGSGAVEEFSSTVTSKIEALKGVFEALAVAFAVEKIGELEAKFGELAEQINRTAQMTGLSTEAVQQFNFAVELTGGSAESAAVTLERFERNMVDATTGTSKAAQIFQTLGISITDSTGKLRPVQDVLGDIADKFHGTADGAQKTAYAIELMGRGGAQLIPILNHGREGLEKMNEELDNTHSKMTGEQIEAFEEYHQHIEILSKSWEGFKLAVADFFLPAANIIVTTLTAIIEKITEAIKWSKELVSSISDWEMFNTDDEMAKKEKGRNASGVPIPVPKPQLPPLRTSDDTAKVDKLGQEKINNAKLVAAEQIKVQQDANKSMLDLGQINNADYLQQKLALQQQLDAIDIKSAHDKLATLQQGTSDYQKALNDELKAKQTAADKERAIQHDIAMDQQKDYLALAGSINSSFTDAFSGLISGSKSAKQAFGDFANSVQQDISKMLAKNLMNSITGGSSAGGPGGLLASLMPGAGGAGFSAAGGSSMFSGLGTTLSGWGSSIAAGASSAASSVGSYFSGFFADGGDIGAGKFGVVGENGPELVMSHAGASVFNSDKLSKMMGGGGKTTINMHINTPNASSFRENQGAIMAAAQASMSKSSSRNL